MENDYVFMQVHHIKNVTLESSEIMTYWVAILLFPTKVQMFRDKRKWLENLWELTGDDILISPCKVLYFMQDTYMWKLHLESNLEVWWIEIWI